MVKARLRYATAGIRRTKMPASIAHMLIAHKALQKLKGKGASNLLFAIDDLLFGI